MRNDLEIRTLPLAQLRPAPYNPRRALGPHSAAYRKLKASLTEFGLVEPLVWNERSGHIVGGHARLRILADLGYTEAPVSVVRLSPAREKALNIVLNNQEAQGRFEPARLAEILTELADLPELDLTGFDHTTLETLRFEPADHPIAGPEEDDRVEVTLVTDSATFERLAPQLDALVREFNLVVHRRGTVPA